MTGKRVLAFTLELFAVAVFLAFAWPLIKQVENRAGMRQARALQLCWTGAIVTACVLLLP